MQKQMPCKVILKADEGKERRSGTGICYNPLCRLKYENSYFLLN
jgi:hypothetical protein